MIFMYIKTLELLILSYAIKRLFFIIYALCAYTKYKSAGNVCNGCGKMELLLE